MTKIWFVFFTLLTQISFAICINDLTDGSGSNDDEPPRPRATSPAKAGEKNEAVALPASAHTTTELPNPEMPFLQETLLGASAMKAASGKEAFEGEKFTGNAYEATLKVEFKKALDTDDKLNAAFEKLKIQDKGSDAAKVDISFINLVFAYHHLDALLALSELPLQSEELIEVEKRLAAWREKIRLAKTFNSFTEIPEFHARNVENLRPRPPDPLCAALHQMHSGTLRSQISKIAYVNMLKIHLPAFDQGTKGLTRAFEELENISKMPRSELSKNHITQNEWETLHDAYIVAYEHVYHELGKVNKTGVQVTLGAHYAYYLLQTPDFGP